MYRSNFRARGYKLQRPAWSSMVFIVVGPTSQVSRFLPTYQRNSSDNTGASTDLEQRALTGELSREEQEELNARNVSVSFRSLRVSAHALLP